MAMLGTLSAVVLGLLTGSSISSLAEKEGECEARGCNSSCLTGHWPAYGPETEPIERSQEYLTQTNRSDLAGGRRAISAHRTQQRGWHQFGSAGPLRPDAADREQRWHRSNALEITNTIAQSRWTTFEQIGSRFPWAFFVVVVSWLAIIFASFGLFAPRNASVIASVVRRRDRTRRPDFHVIEMDRPYGGLVKIPSTSLRIALDQMGRS